MGFVITDTTADFSSLGFGSILPEENYILNAGITNNTHKTAIRTFYSTLKSTGLINKFSVMRMYFAGTALADSINLIKPFLGSVNNQAIFVNDNSSAHIGGYTPSGSAGRYERSQFFPNGSINNIHAHVWNTTPAGTDNAQKYLFGAGTTNANENYLIYLQRRSSTYSKAVVSPYNAPVNILSANGYDTQRTGLISISRQAGGVAKMYDDATIIKTQTLTDTWTTNGGSELLVGTLLASGTTNYADCTLRFFGIGFSDWTDADEINLNSAIKTFNTAIA